MTNQILDSMSKDQLVICREIIARAIAQLPKDKVVKQASPVGIWIGDSPDDPGRREMKVFRLLRGAFGKAASGNETGRAVDKFVREGVKIKGDKVVYKQTELKKLNNELSGIMGPDVAKKVSSDVQTIVRNQWAATKKFVAKETAKVKRKLDKGFRPVDKATIKVINNQNNFFISGTYNKLCVDKVNKIVAKHVEQGLHARALAQAMKASIGNELPQHTDFYYRLLANDVLNRARIFSTVNAFEEARVRKYEIFAVMDERTSEICEYMDGRVFEVELARKVVKDINSFGIPTSRNQVDQFKALRPWVFFDSDRSGANKNALYFFGPDGGRQYLPDSKFGAGGDWLGKANDKSTRQIENMAGANQNAPQLPPFHAHCRTTVVISEEDIRLQEWSEGLGGTTLVPGQKMLDIGTRTPGFINTLAVNPSTGKPIIKYTEGTKAPVTVKPSKILQTKTPTEIPAAIPVSKTLDTELSKQISKEAEKIPAHPADKLRIRPNKEMKKRLTAKQLEKDIKRVRDVLKESVPPEFMGNVKFVEIHYSKIAGKRTALGDFTYDRGRIRLSLGEKLYQDRFVRRNIREFGKTIVHEVGHGVHPARYGFGSGERQKGLIPDKVWSSWQTYDDKIRRAKRAKWISEYAKKNEKEHFCECFGWYYRNPKLLAKREPAAFEWFEKNIKPITKSKSTS